MVKREFVEERHRKLLEYIDVHKRAEVSDLVKQFSVTEVTIRRDLLLLEKQEKIIRTHGGAISLQNRSIWRPTEIGIRQNQFRKEKAAIAVHVASLVKDGESLFIDSGSTTLAASQVLASLCHNLLVITNGPTIAQLFAGVNGNKVIVTGGFLQKETDALIGVSCLRTLECYQTDKAIVGVSGINPERGFYASAEEEAALKRMMISHAAYSIILGDSSKIGANAIAFITGLKGIDLLITDNGITEEQYAALQAQGTNIQTVQAPEEKKEC